MNIQRRNKSSYWIGAIFLLLAFIVLSVNAYASQMGSLTVRKFSVENYENLKEATGQASDNVNIPEGAKTIEGVNFSIEKLWVGISDVNVTNSTPVDPSFPKVCQTTDASGETIFNNLPEGYYLVTEEIPDGFDALGNGAFIIRIPMEVTDTQGNKSDLYNVTFYPKNREIKVKKELIDERIVAGIGDIVSWKVDYPVGSDLKKEDTSMSPPVMRYGKNFYITDDMDSRLDYVDNSATLSFFDRNKMEVSGFTMQEGTDYHISYDISNHTLRIDFTDGVGTNKIADENIVTIELNLSTKINEGAIVSTSPIVNNAKIAYSNGNGDPYEHKVFLEGTSPDDIRVPKVYVGEIEITSINQETGEVLAGVQFALARTEEDARNGIFMTQEVNGRQEPIIVVTDANGKARIVGVGEGTYYLVEIQEPEGFVPLSTPIQVTIGNDVNSRVAHINVYHTKVGDTPTPTTTITPTSTNTQEPEDGSGTSMGAKTGDVTSIVGLIIVAIASAGIVMAFIKRHKVRD